MNRFSRDFSTTSGLGSQITSPITTGCIGFDSRVGGGRALAGSSRTHRGPDVAGLPAQLPVVVPGHAHDGQRRGHVAARPDRTPGMVVGVGPAVEGALDRAVDLLQPPLLPAGPGMG